MPATMEEKHEKKIVEDPEYKRLLKETAQIISRQLREKNVLLGDEYLEEEARDLLSHLELVEEKFGKKEGEYMSEGYHLTDKGRKLLDSKKEADFITKIYSKAIARRYETAARAS